MTQKEAAGLLQKYVSGNANEQEIQKVEEWYGSLPAYHSLSDDRKAQIAESMREKIRHATRRESIKTRFFDSPWIKIAALLFIILSASLFFLNIGKHISESQMEIVAYTKGNERKEITLPDSSKVILEPHTQISYPAHFSPGKRMVKLAGGNAFFSVVHDSKRSFCVRLKSNLEVMVLGTSFRVCDVAEEDIVKITVSTGKVAVRHGSNPVGTLIKGQALSFNKKSGSSSVHLAARTNVVSLSFDGSSLAEVVQKMEYVYSIKIQVENPVLLNLKCTADFNSGQEPSEILDILCKLHHLRFVKNQDQQSYKIYQ